MQNKPRWKGARCESEGFSQAATKVFNTRVEINSLDNEYDLEIPMNTITDQGLLIVGGLIPKRSDLPSFTLRWDEKADHLNVDMSPQEKDWEIEINGYKGHRLQKSTSHDGRAFVLIIKTPTVNVIDAIISFNLARDICATASIGIHGSASHS